MFVLLTCHLAEAAPEQVVSSCHHQGVRGVYTLLHPVFYQRSQMFKFTISVQHVSIWLIMSNEQS